MKTRTSTVEQLHIPFRLSGKCPLSLKLNRIYSFMKANKCGFILRWRGEEFAITPDDISGDNKIIFENYLYRLSLDNKIYIRKGWE